MAIGSEQNENKRNVLKVNSLVSIFSVNWALMNNCNYKCSYCHSDLNSGSIKAPPYEVAVNFIKLILERSNSSMLTPYFEFGGGEVTLLRYFPDIIKLIHDRQGLVNIVSNGSKLLQWWNKNSHFLHGVSLSFHINDIKSESHFIEVSKILEASESTRFHVNIMMVPERFDDCLAFANRLKQEVRCSIALQPLFEGFGHGGITKKYSSLKVKKYSLVSHCMRSKLNDTMSLVRV